jgi:hypothetical protein
MGDAIKILKSHLEKHQQLNKRFHEIERIAHRGIVPRI